MDSTARSANVGSRYYEDFVPSSDWFRGEGSDTLITELKGFKKEQLKVQLDNYGKLRISGERPLGGDRWQRFCKEGRLPENCNAGEIRAKFENGMLTITLPRLATEDEPAAAVPSQTQAPEPPAMPTPSEPEPDDAKEEHGKGVSENVQEEVVKELGKGKSGLGMKMKRRGLLMSFAIAAVVMIGVGMYVAHRYRKITEAESAEQLLDFDDVY